MREERDKLRESVGHLQYFRAAVELSARGIMAVHAREGRYLFANAAYAKMVGRTVEELLAADAYSVWIAVTHPDDVERERVFLEQMSHGQIDEYTFDKRMFGSDGVARWVSANIVGTREPDGRLETITGYFRCIEDQRFQAQARERLETELRHAQKLEALGKLAGGIAHDFNNRLVIMMGHTELIKRNVPTNETVAAHAEIVLDSAHRAAELTRQLLAYGRRQVLVPQAFDVNSSVDTMRRLLERLIGEHIELVTSLGAEHNVYSDPGQIEQVILNLVLNARDAMPSGGKLTLRTSDVTVQPRPGSTVAPGDYVVLEVKDTGSGISEEALPRIFEPFFTTKEVGSGSGLGLATVEGIVHQSGGAVRVASRVGEGSTFTIHLPRAAAAPVAQRTSRESLPPREGAYETVLVCDDDDGVRKLMVNLLELRAYTVLEARDGQHALEIAERYPGPIHLLVTDVIMPKLGGIELAKKLRERHDSLAVLYVSGYTEDTAFISEADYAGMRFLAKPFLPRDLTRAVGALLELRTA